MSKLINFLDDEGKVKAWPSKKAMKIEVLNYIAGKFEEQRLYSEKEVNQLIEEWHLFGDYFMIRRGMIDYKMLGRTRNGSQYWKIESEKDA